MGKKTRRNEGALVRYSLGKPSLSINDLGGLIESRDVDSRAKAELDEMLATLKPGTHGAFKLCRAADEIEDGDFLFHVAKLGFPEAFGAHTMERLILAEAPAAIIPLVEAQAATIASEPKDGAYVVAEFGAAGSAMAVNGILMVDDNDKVPSRPKNYVLTESEEVEIDVAIDTKIVAKKLATILGLESQESDILSVLTEGLGSTVHATATGDVEIWKAVKSNPPRKNRS